MATYVIGDVQGCHAELQALVDAIDFDLNFDRLWFVGDLVNRGPASLEVLRFVRALGECAICLLGNHDLHLLACACGAQRVRKKDTLNAVLGAPDCDELLHWIRTWPLIHSDQAFNITMVHAGLPPAWDVAAAAKHAGEVQDWLCGDRFESFIDIMYGNLPDRWSADLGPADRARYTVNALTRIRYCYADGRLDFSNKAAFKEHLPGLVPWFDYPQRASNGCEIVFGHWSTMRLSTQQAREKHIYPLDTGCVWGGRLTALRLDDRRLFSVPSDTRVPIC